MYEQPTFPPTGGSAQPTGKALLRASWQLLRQDRELLWLPVLSAVAGLFAAVVLFVPGFALGSAVGGSDSGAGGWVGGVLAAFGASVVSIYFQAALVVGANQRAAGQDPTLRGCLAAAWALRGRIVRWALLTTTAGTLIRTLEQRLGVIGRLIGFLGGLAWAIASFLVVPVLVAEDLGPVQAVKRSGALIKATWGSSLRTTLRFGLVQLVLLVPALVAIVAGTAGLASGTVVGAVLGGLALLAGVVALLGLVLVFSAIGGYARALIYRYATGQPVPGIDPALFAGVFRPRRGRFARA